MGYPETFGSGTVPQDLHNTGSAKPIEDSPYLGAGNGKLFSNGTGRHYAFQLSNLSHLIVTKFVRSVCVSAFRDHVLNIYRLASKPKVVRVYAGRIVTFMQHALRFGNLPVVNLPAYAMGRHASATTTLINGAVPDFLMLSPVAPARNPGPALTKPWSVFWNRPILVHLFPKTVLYRSGYGKPTARLGAKSRIAVVNLAGWKRKWFEAMLAVPCNRCRFVLHRSDRLICDALQVLLHAGAFLYPTPRTKGVN